MASRFLRCRQIFLQNFSCAMFRDSFALKSNSTQVTNHVSNWTKYESEFKNSAHKAKNKKMWKKTNAPYVKSDVSQVHEGPDFKIPPMKDLFKQSYSLDVQNTDVEESDCTEKNMTALNQNGSSLSVMPVNKFKHHTGGFRVMNNVVTKSKGRVHKLEETGLSKWASTEQLIEQSFNELIEKPDLAKDWTEFGKKYSDNKYLSKKWPTLLLFYIAHRNDHVITLFEIGMSLAEYVKTLGDKYSVIHLVTCVSLCVHQGGEKNHGRAFEYYDELSKLTDVLDFQSASLLIRAFAKTSQWQKCFEFLEMLKTSTTPSPGIYSPLIKAALKANETKIADNLFLEMSQIGIVPMDDVFEYMINLGMVSKLLEMLRNFRWIPSESVAELIQKSFLSLCPTENWTAQRTKINKRLKCQACFLEVDRLPRISDDDFDRLKTVFMQEVILRKGNVFLNTSPKEVDDYNNFLNRHPSFDIIIDGLNVAYKTYQSSPEKVKDNLLSQVIQHFIEKGMKVLVLGRNHMRNWKSTSLHHRMASGSLEWFFADNLSADDRFMIYAALHSGQQTSILTSDHLRDHRFLLGPELADLLKLWQRGHQIEFVGSKKQSGGDILMFKWPDNHDTRVQIQNGDTWHIPFDNGADRASFQLPKDWICLRRTGN